MRFVSLSEVPPEILEGILLFLPPTDILRMKEISHSFLDLISSSHHLQHRIDLFGTGLIDSPQVVCGLAERRARFREYVDRWKDPETSTQYDFPLENQVGAMCPKPICQDLFFAPLDDGRNTILFTHIPSSPNQGAIEWTLELPFHSARYLASLRDNLLAVVEYEAWSTNIHLLNLLDGSPHDTPLRKVLTLSLEGLPLQIGEAQCISGSVMALVFKLTIHSMTEGRPRKLIVVDWKTGEVALEYSTTDPGIGGAISRIIAIDLLEGSWLLSVFRDPNLELFVLNTQLPRHDPRSWRLLQLPPLAHHGTYKVVTQYGDPLAERSGFSADPAQRNFLLYSYGLTLVVPVEVLKRTMAPVRDDPRIPWEEWGKDVITIQPRPDTWTFQLVDTKALALGRSEEYVEIYDLSKMGRKDTQARLVSLGLDEKSRRIPPTLTRYNQHRIGDGRARRTYFVRNKVVSFCSRASPAGEVYYLRIWEIG